MMQQDKSMFLVAGEWNMKNGESYETFKMMPNHIDCPYNEAIYNKELRVLFVLSKEKKNNLQKIPNTQDEIMIEMWYEYQLSTPSEIINFAKMFCTNEETFNYTQYMN